ncbi:MAG: hypothetical protein LBJ83_00985 [Oscillospiraceae bacterium]|jgi:hypothetical protein|nr:hypothetical protein [Oscillospiraceae bacterium]
MSSSEKTKNIGLNLWKGTDRPERDDFNSDNVLIDKAVGDLRNMVTRPTGETGFFVGEYVGNGESKRIIKLDFEPRLVFLFCVGDMFLHMCDESGQNVIKAALLIGSKGTMGILPHEKGFVAISALSASPYGKTPLLNEEQKNYVYVAIK